MDGMVRKFLFATLIFSLMLLGGCRSMIYYPTPKQGEGSNPANTLMLEMPDASVAVSIRPHEGPKALIYFGGNAEDVSRSLPVFAQKFPDYALYLMHYRGYGNSTGQPSEAALHADAQVLFDKSRPTPQCHCSRQKPGVRRGRTSGQRPPCGTSGPDHSLRQH